MDGVRHDYVYASGQLLRETYTQSGTSYTLDFLYDQNGRPYLLYLTKTTSSGTTYAPYYYILNLQGDVIYLVNTSGAAVASYTYDPYGSILTSAGSLASVNPLRYRGYYYDAETGFYYLQSRYYDPALGRFINADSYASTGQGFLGYNMFAYCNNNPTHYSDESGLRPMWEYDFGDGVSGYTDTGTGSNGYNDIGYNRSNAVSYARQYGGTNNNNYPYYSRGEGGDCTNFVSQCLYEGGIRCTSDWYCISRSSVRSLFSSSPNTVWTPSLAWSYAPANYAYLVYNLNREEIVVKSIDELSSVYGVREGDLLFFENKNGIHHAAIITKIVGSKIMYTQHSDGFVDFLRTEMASGDIAIHIIKMG